MSEKRDGMSKGRLIQSDRIIEEHLRVFDPEDMESGVTAYLQRVYPLFEHNSGIKAISLFINPQGDDIFLYSGENEIVINSFTTIYGAKNWSYRQLRELIVTLKKLARSMYGFDLWVVRSLQLHLGPQHLR